MSYAFLTRDVADVTDHAAHSWEEWHAYLSPDYPGWISPDASGVCCHTCRVIITDAP